MSRMETYPTSISLGEESAQMWSLNKRLEAYLTRVKVLEEENNLLRAEIHHLKSTRSDKSFIRKYHDEMMTLRDALDDGHREMVLVETDRDAIYQELEYVKELCLHEKQAQEDVKKELSESKKLMEEEKRTQIWLKERLFQLEQEMEDIFIAHEEEKALMEKEISSYSQRLENFKIAPVNFKPVNVEDYAIQLSQIWQGAVEEYKNKVSNMEANLTQAKENLKKVVDENKQSQLQLQNLDGDLESLKNRKEMLEGLLAKQWLEQQDEEGRLQLEIETMEKEKQDLRIQIAQVLEDRQQLMHLKMSLSLEVATYRSLLEAESTRPYSPGMSSSFNDLQLEQTAFRKSHHGNTKQLIPRLNTNKKQSAETPSIKRYLNVKSTSTANRTSPVTKEFQKVSSVLQSQGLKYTKASSSKTATTLPPLESNLKRHPQKGDVFKKNQLETIMCSSKSVTKEILRKDTNIQPVVNGNARDKSDKELKKKEHMDDSISLTEKEAVSAQVESSLKTEGIHIEVDSDFVFEKQHNVVETQNKDNDALLVEKPNEKKIDFESPRSLSEGFGNINEEHIVEKEEVFGQIMTRQRLYVETEQLVKPLVTQNIETPIKINNEEFRKVLDFSKSKTNDLNEINVPTSDGIPELVIEYSHSQELTFGSPVSLNDTDVDKEVTNHVVEEEKESLQLNKVFKLEESLGYVEADLQDEDVTVVQNLQVLCYSKEDSNPLSDGQNIIKNIYDEQKREIEQYNVHSEKDTEQVPQNTKIQEYDNEIDHLPSSQVDKILAVDSHNDVKPENTPFDLETQDKLEVCDASESSSYLSKEEDFREENKKEEMEDYEGNYKYEENILNAEGNIHDSTNIKQTRILVVKEVYQSSNQVMDDLKETQHLDQEEKNSLQLSGLEQTIQSYDNQQKTEIVEASEEMSQNITDISQEVSEDQKNNVQKERNQLSEEDNLQPGSEDLKTVCNTEQESELENKHVVQTLDSKKGDGFLDIQSESKLEDLYEIVHEETIISNKGEESHQIEQSNVKPLSVQSTPEHEIQSSEGEGCEKDGQSLENNPIEEGDINTSLCILKNSELNVCEEGNKDVSEENYLVCTAVGFTKTIKTKVCVQELYNIVEGDQEIMIQERQLLKNETNVILDEVAVNELEENSSFHQEVEEGRKDFPQEEEKVRESYQQDVDEEHEVNLQKVKEEKEHYYQELKEMQESYHKEVKEGQESYQYEEAHQEGDHQEVEDQVGREVLSTLIEPLASEEDDKSNYSFPKDSNEEQLVGFSLSIIQNNLRFSSENDEEVQAEQQEQRSKFSDETETRKAQNNDLEEEWETLKQDSDGIILEEKEKAQDIFETKIICQQSTFLSEHECENVIEVSKSHVVLAKNLTEKYDFDGLSEKHIKELDAMEVSGGMYYDNSKSEYSMDSQDISICSQKSEECEISKEYQLEQTLPDTTPLPNLDEFEDLAEDEIITASEDSAQVIKTPSPDGGETEDILDSSLESQSSQILSKESEPSILFKDDEKGSDYTEKQDEKLKALREMENPEKPKLDTEDSCATPDTVNASAELSEDLVDSKMDDVKSEFEELTTSQEEVEESKDSLLGKTQSETTFLEDQVQLSSNERFSESVDEDHCEEPEERRQILSEDTYAENVLPKTFDCVLSSEHSETKLVPDPSNKVTKEMEEHISEEHSDLVKQDFGLEQNQTISPEDHERDLCKKDTILLPNLDDESENLEDVEIILASEQSAEVTKLQSPVDSGENEELLDNSLETQSSQIFPEVSEQSNVMKDDGNDYDYHDQEAESPKDLLESENHEYFEQQLDTEDCSATTVTKKLSSKPSEDEVDSKINVVKFETQESTTAQEEVAVVSPKVDDFETCKDSQMEETQFETSCSQDQVRSSEQLVNKSVEEDYNEEPKESIIPVSEDAISENVITVTLDLASSSEHNEIEVVYASSHEDTKENEEYITKEHSDLVKEDFGQEQAKIIDSDDHASDICKEDTTPLSKFSDELGNLEDDEIILARDGDGDKQVLDSNYRLQSSQNVPEVSEQSILFKDEDYNEQQHEGPKDLLESKNPDQFEEPKLETENCSETLDTKESATDLSGNQVESKQDDENSEESITSQVKVDIFSVKVDGLEESNDSHVSNTQFEAIASEDQVQLSSEQLVSESGDEDHNEEHEERKPTLGEDTGNVVTETLDFVSSSEHSESELIPDPCLEDTKEEEEHLMKEHSDLVRQDLVPKETQSVNTEEYERNFSKEDTAPLPNLDNESKNLENNDILESEPSAEVTKSQNPKNGGEADELLDSSLESQSSHILPEVSEQSNMFKDDKIDSDYNEHQSQSPEDFLGSENPENQVQPKMDKEDSPATLDTEKPSAGQSVCPIDSKINDETSESKESTTLQEEDAVFSSKVEELEASKDSELKKIQLETSSENQAQLVSESVDQDLNIKPEERRITVGEEVNTENVQAKMLDFIPTSEQSDTELFPASCLEDTKEKEEDIMKEQSDFVTHDFKSKQTESVDTEDHEGDFCKKDTTPLPKPDSEFENLETNEIFPSKQSAEVTKTQSPDNGGEAEEVLDSSLESQSSQVLIETSEQSILFKDDIDSKYDEQQVESPKDLLESESSAHFGAEDSSVTLDTKNPAAELSEDPVDSKMDEKKSENPTTFQEDDVVSSLKDDEFETRKDSVLEKTPYELTSSEGQVQLSSEQLVSESVDEDHNEESEEIGLTLCEDTNREDELTETCDVMPSSERSELELVIAPCLEEKEEYIMKEHSDFITQDFVPKQTESMIIKDDERDFCKKDTTPLPNPDDEFENLESNEILASEQSAEVIKLQSPDDTGEADEVLDTSIESQDSDYNEQQGDSPKGLLESENPEHVVETKLDTEDASATLDTEKSSADLSEDSLDSKMEDEKYASEEPTTSWEDVAVFSPKDSELEKTQFETSSEDQVQLSSEQLVSQSIAEDHNEKPEVLGLTLSEDTNKEEGVTEISSENSKIDLIPAQSLEDTKESEEHIIKEHSDFLTQDFPSNQTESVNIDDHEGDFCKDTILSPNLDEEFEILETHEILGSEQSAEVTQLESPCDGGVTDELLDSSLESQSSQILTEVSGHSISFKDDDKDPKQGGIPKDLLESENPDLFVEAKLDKKYSSVSLDSENVSIEPCEDPVESIMDDEKSTTSQEQVAVLSPKVDAFEGSKDSLLEPTQFETSSENQVQLYSEHLVTESVDEDHEEEPEEKRLSEVTNTENVLTKTLNFVPSSEQSETELVPIPCQEDIKHSEIGTHDLGLKETESINGDDHEGNFCSEDTKPLSIPKNNNLEDYKIILSSEQSAEVTKSQSPTDGGEAEEVLDSSLESQSSQIFPDVSEQSILFKDDEIVSNYNEQQGESPEDLLEGENPEQYIEPKLETEKFSARLETKETADELSEYPEDSKIFDEKSESEEPTTYQEEIAFFSPKAHEFEASKDSKLEKKQFETTSSEQLISKNVGEDHNEEPEERRLTLSESTNTEYKLSEILDFVRSSEHSETALVSAPDHEDTKEEEEHIIKEHFDSVTKDFILEQKASVKTEDHEKELFKEHSTQLANLNDEPKNLEDDEIISASEQSAEVTESHSPDDGEAEELFYSSLDSQSSQVLHEVRGYSTSYKDDDMVSDCNEQQGKSPKDLLESENPEQLVETKLETEDCFAKPDAEEPFAELSEYPVESKIADEKSESQEPTTSQEEVAIVLPKLDEFEGSKDSQLEENQTEIPPSGDQVQVSSEQMVTEEHEEGSKGKSLTLDEDTNTDIVLTETDLVPSSEHSHTELVSSPSHHDITENKDYIKKEDCNLLKHEFELVQMENVDTEDHETDFYKEKNRQCDVDLINDSKNELSSKSLDESNENNIITSNLPDILKGESEVPDGMTQRTNQEDVNIDVKPSGESSENDESVTSDESLPNVSTISYGHEQQESSDTDSKISKQAKQNDPLWIPEPVPEGSFMEQIEPQSSSGEEKDILSERSDSSFDSNKEHEDISEFTREYIEDGKTMNGIFGHTIVQATLDLEDHMFYGHSTKEEREIIISEAKTIVRLDGGVVKSQSQDKNEDSVFEFTTSERKSEGLFQSLFEASECKESHVDEAAEIKNKTDSAAGEQSQYSNKLINPYISERDLDDPSKITSSVMDECLVNTKQEVNEVNQGLKISQQEDSWSSDE